MRLYTILNKLITNINSSNTLIGSTSISSIGDGTLTGNINRISNNLPQIGNTKFALGSVVKTVTTSATGVQFLTEAQVKSLLGVSTLDYTKLVILAQNGDADANSAHVQGVTARLDSGSYNYYAVLHTASPTTNIRIGFMIIYTP